MSDSKTQATKNHRSLAATLSAAFLGLSVTTLLVAGGLEMYFGFQAQRKSIADQQQSLAENAAGQVRAFVQERLVALEATASIGSLPTARQEEQKVVLEKLLGLEPAFRQVLLYDAQRRQLHRVSRLSKLASRTLDQCAEHDRAEMFTRVRQGETYVGPVCVDDITSEPMVMMAVPVTNVFGDFKGTLAAEVNLKFMWELVGGLRIGRGGLAYVVDKDGDLIAFKDIGRVLKGENLIRLEEVGEFVRGDRLTHRSSADIVEGIQGGQVVANHAHLGKPDWAVVVELPITEAYAHVILGAGLSAGVIILGAVLAIAVGLYLAKTITRPIVSLMNATKAVSEGDLDARIEVESGDEIGELAASFNQMIDDLRNTTVSRDSLAIEVAERRRAEMGLSRAKARLQREITDKNEFLRVVSHDMGAPLRNIMGMVDSVSRRHGENLPEEAKDRLARVRRNAEAEMSLIGELLELSRIGTRRQAVVEVNVGDVVREAVDRIAEEIEAKGIRLVLDEEWPVLWCEKPRLVQVFQNLIDNAAKYMGARDGARIEVGWREEPERHVFHVGDNGVGIAPEDKEKVFHVFRRTRSAASQAEGKGVGLAAVKAIAESHDGEAWVESELGRGSTFYFSLAKARVLRNANEGPPDPTGRVGETAEPGVEG